MALLTNIYKRMIKALSNRLIIL